MKGTLFFLVGWAFYAAAQRLIPSSQLIPESWSSTYPEILIPRITEHIFRDNKEYRYLYDGQILTGIPEAANQFSGLRIRTIFTIQLRDGVDLFKIEKATLGRLNERHILGGPLKLQPIQDFEELQGEEAQEWETALTKPIRFEYTNGIVTNMVSVESDPFWSVNVKRSILATFNVNLQKPSVLAPQLGHQFLTSWDREVSDSGSAANAVYFTVTEEGIGGECEATYVIQSLPTGTWGNFVSFGSANLRNMNVLNVTKTWDYSKCNNRPIEFDSLNNPIKCETLTGSSICNQMAGNDKENIIDSAAHTRYNILGTRAQFIIEKAMTEGVHKITPFSEDAGSLTAYINATMRLIYSGDWSRDSVLPRDAGITLKGLGQLFPKYSQFREDKYAFEAAEASQPFWQPRGQWPNIMAKKAVVAALMDRLVEDLSDNEVEPDSANVVLQLSVILEYATPEEVAEIHQAVKLMSHKSFDRDQIQNLWMDVLALSGTKPTALFIKREIASGRLVGERAAQVINTLAFSMRKPDQDIIAEILDLCKSPAVMSHSSLKKACWLSFGTLAHTSCVNDLETTTSIQNTLVKTGNPHCTPEGRRRFVMEIVARLKTTQSLEDKILLLKTLGNAGFVEAVPELKAIFSDDSQPEGLRMDAIWALFSHIAPSQPDVVLAVLMPEFYDLTNPIQVRIAAFETIIEAKPNLPALELFARSLHTERSVQVGSYVYSKLAAVANSTNPCFDQLAKDASLALEFAKPFRTGMSFSKGFNWGIWSDKLEAGVFVDSMMIADAASILPRSAVWRLNTNMLGLSHDIVEFGFNTEGVTAVLKRLFMSRDDVLTNPASVLDFMNANDIDDDEMTNNYGPFSHANPQSMRYRSGERKSWIHPELDEIDRILGIPNSIDQDIKGSAFFKIFGQEVRFLTLTPKSIIKMITDSYLKPSEMVGLMRGRLPVDYRKALMAGDTEITIPTELGIPLTVELKIPVVVSAKGSVGLSTQPSLSASALSNIPSKITVESDVVVSVATEIHGKMSVWAAYFKIGTGVQTKISAVVPLNGAVSLDVKSGKLHSTMNLPERPMELLKVEVLPMTYTKYSPKNQVPHQPDRKDMFDTERSQKVLQYNSQPLESNLPVQFFSYKTDLMENPFMLTPGGRVNTEYYRGIPIPIVETKEISTFDVIKTKFYNVQIGHPALGGLIDVTGHVQLAIGAPTTPMVPVGGKNRVVVTLKPFNAGLKSIDVALIVRQNQVLGAAAPVWGNLFDQLVGYNSEAILQRLNHNLPTGFEKSDKLGVSTQLIVQGTSTNGQELAMQGVFSWVRGLDGKFVKLAGDFVSPHPQLSYMACVNGHAEYPGDYMGWNMIPGINKPITGHFEIAFGRSCNSPDATKIATTYVGDKSPEQVHWEKNDQYTVEGAVVPNIVTRTVEPLARTVKPLFLECQNDRKRGIIFSSACETVKAVYSTLMQMKVDIKYQNLPYGIEKILTKAERLMKSMNFWNTEIDDVRVKNAPNTVTVLMNFASVSERMDIVYSTPNQNVKMLNIRAPYPMTPMSGGSKPMDMWESILGENFDAMCTVSGGQLNTLDSASFNVPFSQCYHLLAKDCSGEETWSVLFASADSRHGDAKKLLAIIGGTKIEMMPAETVTSQYQSTADMVILVNGRPVSGSRSVGQLMLDQGVEITMESSEESMAPYYRISAPQLGVEVWFDGHNAALKPTFWLRNQICGICGNNNGEAWDDMMLPTGTMATSLVDLARGYMVRKDDCGDELPSLSALKQQSLFPSASVAGCGQMKTVVKTRPGKVCFSVEPVQTCAPGCMGDSNKDEEDYMFVKRVPFHCIPEDSSLASRLLEDAESRVLTEIRQKPANDWFALPNADRCNVSGGPIRRVAYARGEIY